jgi:tetratricopeptide (TPR) repeat protein
LIRRLLEEDQVTSPTAELPPGATAPPSVQAVDLAGDTVSWRAAPEALENGGKPAATGSSPAHLLRRVGQFVLLERLGAGGMGVVFAAFDEQLERKVAIKLVATQGSNDRAQQRLLREAQAQGRLSHPNVVTVYEVGTLPEGGLFIAMELVKGQTLGTWQDAGPRTWREIVAMYTAAGEGLAAAHRGGVVHRDFKPDNVLVGEDGRARVADFGLASAAEPEAAAGPGPADAQPLTRSGRRAALTAAGAVMGTPGYMAPEQFRGAAADARSDQFSFCVALYEALHDQRPYADLAFVSNTPPAPRRVEDPAYPPWLWDVILRGLALDPDARFASMDALLAELTRSPARTRRRVLAAGASLGVLAIVGVTASALTGSSPPPCPPATAELAGIWDLATKPRIQAALLGTGTPFAASVWASTQAAFDRYAERWIGAQQAACEATHVRHVQSTQLMDRRMECLAGRRRSLAAATEVLQSRPAQAVLHAGEILNSLGDIALCSDTGALLALPALGAGPAAPANPGTQALVADVRRRLTHAAALLATGDGRAAESVVTDRHRGAVQRGQHAGDGGAAESVVTEAAQIAMDLHDDPLRAELRYMEGRVKFARDDVAGSIALFNQAAELAVASHHDELLVDIWLTLALNAGRREQRPAEIELWLGQSEAWLRRLNHTSDPRLVELEHARGNLQLTAGDARTAQVTLSRALEAAVALWGKDDPRLIPLLRDRALVLARLRQAKPAVADGERALALGIAAWGPDYPDIDIAGTRRALGLLYIEQPGAVERGEHELILAREIYRTQLGADSTEVANCEQALSKAGMYRGDYAAALAHAEQAEQIYGRRLGADHTRHGEALNGVGVLRFMRKDFAGSLAAYEAAYPILRAALGTGHPTVGILLSNTGETLLALARAELAQDYFARALDILRKSQGPEHADLALPLKGLGLVHLSRGQPREALAPFERALALRTQSAAANDPQELAEIRWGLARTLRALGRDPARARALAEAAAAGYRSLGSESAERVQEILRWLAAGVHDQ